MSFSVGVVAHFTAEHHLVGDFGPATARHAHNYKVDVLVSGDSLRPDSTLFDITRLQAALSMVTGHLDGRDLNELAELATSNPTAETVARYIHQRVAPALASQGLTGMTVRVWESPEAYASYAAELATTSRS
jgi:6-pyruvoyltetrahydropterin/6-carboxytetrahydropterin synthase